eukprot:1136127-Pelagomonas_calceolata.AAC.4
MSRASSRDTHINARQRHTTTHQKQYACHTYSSYLHTSAQQPSSGGRQQHGAQNAGELKEASHNRTKGRHKQGTTQADACACNACAQRMDKHHHFWAKVK